MDLSFSSVSGGGRSLIFRVKYWNPNTWLWISEKTSSSPDATTFRVKLCVKRLTDVCFFCRNCPSFTPYRRSFSFFPLDGGLRSLNAARSVTEPSSEQAAANCTNLLHYLFLTGVYLLLSAFFIVVFSAWGFEAEVLVAPGALSFRVSMSRVRFRCLVERLPALTATEQMYPRGSGKEVNLIKLQLVSYSSLTNTLSPVSVNIFFDWTLISIFIYLRNAKWKAIP